MNGGWLRLAFCVPKGFSGESKLNFFFLPEWALNGSGEVLLHSPAGVEVEVMVDVAVTWNGCCCSFDRNHKQAGEQEGVRSFERT